MRMSNFVLGFLAGAVVVDFLWAWKMGIVTLVWSRLSRVFNGIFRK
jgi:hypothetical protein